MRVDVYEIELIQFSLGHFWLVELLRRPTAGVFEGKSYIGIFAEDVDIRNLRIRFSGSFIERFINGLIVRNFDGLTVALNRATSFEKSSQYRFTGLIAVLLAVTLSLILRALYRSHKTLSRHPHLRVIRWPLC